MHLAFTIPVWLIWSVGIVAGIAVLLLATLGVVFLNFVSHRWE